MKETKMAVADKIVAEEIEGRQQGQQRKSKKRLRLWPKKLWMIRLQRKKSKLRRQ